MKPPSPFGRRRAPQNDKTVVAILGMHRSGTSWLTGSLQELGLELGEVNTSAKSNLKGNRENRTIQVIHNRVLEKNGGSWREPPPAIRWPRRYRKQLADHIASMNALYDMWGFKDPRTLLMLDEWRDQVPSLTRVGIYRHPHAVVRSLKNRQPNFTDDEAFGLWRIYNEHLLAEHRRGPFPVIRFDVPADVLSDSLNAISDHLGLPRSQSGFFDENLVHDADASKDTVPSELSPAWDALEAIAVGVDH